MRLSQVDVMSGGKDRTQQVSSLLYVLWLGNLFASRHNYPFNQRIPGEKRVQIDASQKHRFSDAVLLAHIKWEMNLAFTVIAQKH